MNMANGVTATPSPFAVGTLVQFRGRAWIVRAIDGVHQLLTLQPLAGSEAEATQAYWPLALAHGDLAEAAWPAPTIKDAGDFTSAALLMDAARLAIRHGAAPLRCMGQVSVRPRPYQLVPLVMALRQNPVRLLIADDVGVGKTVEAGLIAKELLERGQIDRVAVLCPPALCEQWRRELDAKFHIEAVVVRSSTISRLERPVVSHTSVFRAYPHLIVSIDFAKGDHWREAFVANCPDFVIVDEAHGATEAGPRGGRGQQQRHALVSALAADPSRHLVLLTATPHSGISSSFASLMGLLDPAFEHALADDDHMAPTVREQLARHLIQRRRGDVRRWLGSDTPLPQRAPQEVPYDLGTSYHNLYQDVVRFTRELVGQGGLAAPRQRLRYWAALALLRSVMSSPAAAMQALDRRASRQHAELSAIDGEEISVELVDELRRPEVLDPDGDEVTRDELPIAAVEEGLGDQTNAGRRRLLAMRRAAEALQGVGPDHKLAALVRVVGDLLQEGRHPIVFCRFVATAAYVGEHLRTAYPGVEVATITGTTPDEERAQRLDEITTRPRRVLVATDCLSEGIDLQQGFDAVVHYDLPWNPNRLEQREGRIDRYGQAQAVVPTILLYGRNNPIDAAVLNVLIRKGRAIYQQLGITVPVPMDSEAVLDALVQYFFLEPARLHQTTLDFDDEPAVRSLHADWDRASERERVSRSRFAQHAIHPDEVSALWEETEAVLGTPRTVARFLDRALTRWGRPVERTGTRLRLPTVALAHVAPPTADWIVVDTDAHAVGSEALLDRNHPDVVRWAERVLNAAFTGQGEGRVARAGAVLTSTVARRSLVAVARLRYRMQEREGRERYAEEVVLMGYQRGRPDNWVPNALDVRNWIDALAPAGNLESSTERDEAVAWGLSVLDQDRGDIGTQVAARAREIEATHRKLSSNVGTPRVQVTPYPPDWLGVYVLIPGGTA
jgi:hypothetical protein